MELFATLTVTLLATVNGPAELALYPVVMLTFSVKILALILTIPCESAERYGLTNTLSPRYVNSILLVPAGGASVNTICPLIKAYESAFCLTPEIQTITDDSLPVPYASEYVV